MVRKMNKRRTAAAIRQKSCLTAGVIALVAVLAMAGSYYKNSLQEKEQMEQVAQVEEEVPETALDDELTMDEDSVDAMVQDNVIAQGGELSDTAQREAVEKETKPESTEETAPQNAEEEEPAAEETVSLSFSQESKIDWPVQGNVLMEYSMDKTVYFATLDQYKYNPAMLIEGTVNTKVVSAADAKILDISTNENTGLTLTADLGDGYRIVYGQLKEVNWNAGDMISAGEVIGYLAEPTKYYCLEGSNLYLAMTKDGEPVNPMTFLK